MCDDNSTVVFRATVANRELAREALRNCHERELLDEQALDAFLSDPACILIIAVRDRQTVGSLNGYILRQPHCRAPQLLLYEIDVLSSCRRQGIGRSLIKAFGEEARAAGANGQWVVSNESNIPAMAMYRSCGYERTHGDDVMLAINSQ